MPFHIPNFRGNRALVIHRADNNQEVLTQRLRQLGLSVHREWPLAIDRTWDPSIIFFDADEGYEDHLCAAIDAMTVPLIAMIGSETPGRLEWVIERRPSAYLFKPLRPTGIFTALVMAFHSYGQVQTLETEKERANDRLKSRHSVFKALLVMMHRMGVDEAEAFTLLRSASMKRRITIEAMSGLVISADEPELRELEAMLILNRKKLL